MNDRQATCRYRNGDGFLEIAPCRLCGGEIEFVAWPDMFAFQHVAVPTNCRGGIVDGGHQGRTVTSMIAWWNRGQRPEE